MLLLFKKITTYGDYKGSTSVLCYYLRSLNITTEDRLEVDFSVSCEGHKGSVDNILLIPYAFANLADQDSTCNTTRE
eukprot:m.266217 g.266217  ORF g.266217 m.266217 type:complete len:77 (-) comp19720_c1_seq4:242-472(-)